MAIHSSWQTIFSLTCIEGITLGAGEEVDEVAGGACGMGVDRIAEVGDKASEGQAAGVWDRFYSKVSGKERSHWWDEGEGEQG